MAKWTSKLVIPVLLAAFALGGIIYLGRLAMDDLRHQDKYKVRFADINCNPPAGIKKSDFLDEVQYLGSLPSDIHLLDKNLPNQLAGAFAKHPWVEKVEHVELKPANKIVIELRHRTPVLAVPWNGGYRAVDAHGILLPRNAPTKGLPQYSGTPGQPKGPAGTAWGDEAVHKRARELAQEKKSTAG